MLIIQINKNKHGSLNGGSNNGVWKVIVMSNRDGNIKCWEE